MKVSFTTLSCPEWSWEKILEEACRLGYDGIEIRGIQGEMSIFRMKPFLPENVEKTLAQLKEKNLAICCLDTSVAFHDSHLTHEMIEEGKASIDLASRMAVPYIRVFGDRIQDEESRQEIIERVRDGLNILGEYAANKGVKVLIETHGDFSDTRNLMAVLEGVNNSSTGILWDIHHPYKICGESIEETYDKLGPYIYHTHIKDSLYSGEALRYCLTGEGDVPIKESIQMLKEHQFDGWLSLEWEKKWIPDLEEPEVVLPKYIQYIWNLLETLD